MARASDDLRPPQDFMRGTCELDIESHRHSSIDVHYSHVARIGFCLHSVQNERLVYWRSKTPLE
jgi:hypothetical protein